MTTTITEFKISDITVTVTDTGGGTASVTCDDSDYGGELRTDYFTTIAAAFIRVTEIIALLEAGKDTLRSKLSSSEFETLARTVVTTLVNWKN